MISNFTVLCCFFGDVVGNFCSIFCFKKYYKNIDLDTLADFFPILIIFSIIGARIYYVLLSFDFYSKYPAEIFAVWHGGIAIHGAILGGIIAGIIYFKFLKKYLFLPYADVISYGFSNRTVNWALGKFFSIKRHLAHPCNLPWKLYIEPAFRPSTFMQYSYFHPAFFV